MRTNRTWKSLPALVLILTLAAQIAPGAWADSIWVPENNFYRSHSDECTYEPRGYLANGAEGFVTLWNAPNDSKVKAQYENGTSLWAYMRWEDWVLVAYREGEQWPSGWVPMADLALTYDYIAFAEEYADQIRPYNFEFGDYNRGIACVNFFEYPGAPEVKESLKVAEMDNGLSRLTGLYWGIRSIFIDEDGLTWGGLNYWDGREGYVWFCLDEPERESFPVRTVPKTELIPARTPVMPMKAIVSAALPWVLTAAVVAVTAVLLVRTARRRKKN